MTSNYDQLVNQLDELVGERNAEIVERGSILKAHSNMVTSKKSLDTTVQKAMGTLASLQKSATAMTLRQNKKSIEQVPAIMRKAQKAFLQGEITGDELCVIEAKKNRLCATMASRGLIR